MKHLNLSGLKISDGFSRLSRTFGLTPLAMLQAFINEVSLFNLLYAIETFEDRKSTDKNLMTMKFISICISTASKGYDIDAIKWFNKTEAQKSLMMLASLVKCKPNQVDDHRKISREITRRLLTNIRRKFDVKNRFFVNDGSELLLSDDYLFVCEMYNCAPKSLLERYMTIQTHESEIVLWHLKNGRDPYAVN